MVGMVGVDTLAVAAPVEPTLGTCRALLTLAADESCERLARWPGQEPRILAPEDLTEGADWEAIRCRLGGLVGYELLLRLLGEGDGIGLAVRRGKPGQAVPQGFHGRLLLGSEVCWRSRLRDGMQADTMEAWAWGMLASRGVLVCMPKAQDRKVRRLDLCCDHWGPGSHWHPDDFRRFATRAKRSGEEWTNDEHSRTIQGPRSRTFYLGGRSAKTSHLRVYRKDVEAEDSGKTHWLHPVWKRWGWDGIAPVWRAEIECGGEWLTNHGMDDARGLRGIEVALWREWTGRTRLTTGNKAKLRCADVHPRWRALQGAPAVAPRGEAWEWAVRPRPGSEDMMARRKQAAGCLAPFQAEFGNTLEGWREFADIVLSDVAAAVYRKGM